MPASIDFASLFEIAPNAYMVLDRDLRYVAANEAYLDATSSRRDQLIGRFIFDLFPNDPADPANLPAQMLRRSLERVLASGEKDHLALIPYRVPKKVGDAFVEEDRYWSATHSPVLGTDGKVAFILQHTVDVTELHVREREGTGQGVRNEAGVLSRARAVQEENTRIDAEREHLRVMFEQAPGFMCVLEGPTHVFRQANGAFLDIIGQREVLGKPVAVALPDVAAQGFVDILDGVYRTGERFVGRGVRVMLQRSLGAPADEVFVDFVYQPLRSADGKVRAIFVQGHDVTSHKTAERAAEAFSQELQQQSREVTAALQQARERIVQLEAELAKRR